MSHRIRFAATASKAYRVAPQLRPQLEADAARRDLDGAKFNECRVLPSAAPQRSAILDSLSGKVTIDRGRVLQLAVAALAACASRRRPVIFSHIGCVR